MVLAIAQSTNQDKLIVKLFLKPHKFSALSISAWNGLQQWKRANMSNRAGVCGSRPGSAPALPPPCRWPAELRLGQQHHNAGRGAPGPGLVSGGAATPWPSTVISGWNNPTHDRPTHDPERVIAASKNDQEVVFKAFRVKEAPTYCPLPLSKLDHCPFAPIL
jgi:hypothetical protein